MSIPKIQIVEPPAQDDLTQRATHGNYKVVSRIIDWITNDRQDALLHDVRSFFEQVVDRNQYYRHNDPAYSDCERKNADSHMRGMLMGQTLSLQVRNATVLLGTWQSIIFAEFDGPRSRSLAVQVSGV